MKQLYDFIATFNINQLAFETGFCKRVPRKITPENFLLSFFLCFSNSHFSIRHWSVNLSRLIGQRVSWQAIDKKIQFVKVNFIKQLFLKVCETNLNNIAGQCTGLLQPFKRVLVQDSTLIKMPNSFYQSLSGVSNGKVKKAITRIQSCIDLVSGKINQVVMCTYSHNDQSFSSTILDLIKPADLVLRDLGYYKISTFKEIAIAGAFFISKFKLSTSLFDNQTDKRVDLLRLLKYYDRNGISTFDFWVTIGFKQKCQVRLCGYKVTPEQALKKRRQMIEARNHKSKISNEAKYFTNWNIFISNIDENTMQLMDVFKVYSLRWSIEMMFKNWKSNLKLDKILFRSKTPNPARPEMLLYLMLLYIALIYRPIYFHMFRIIKEKYNLYLSPMKFSNYMTNNFSMDTIMESNLELELIARTCTYDKRKDRCNFSMLLEKFILLS
jgi:hypothetical protein